VEIYVFIVGFVKNKAENKRERGDNFNNLLNKNPCEFLFKFNNVNLSPVAILEVKSYPNIKDIEYPMI
jgi:hypothetical protein